MQALRIGVSLLLKCEVKCRVMSAESACCAADSAVLFIGYCKSSRLNHTSDNRACAYEHLYHRLQVQIDAFCEGFTDPVSSVDLIFASIGSIFEYAEQQEPRPTEKPSASRFCRNISRHTHTVFPEPTSPLQADPSLPEPTGRISAIAVSELRYTKLKVEATYLQAAPCPRIMTLYFKPALDFIASMQRAKFKSSLKTKYLLPFSISSYDPGK